MECFFGLHGVLPAVPDISHQQNLPVTEHPAAACPDDVQLPEEEKEEDINTYLPLNPPRQKRASKKFEPEAIELPDWLPETLWHEWVQFRQALRKPIRTEQGANGAIRELEKFRQQGFSPEQVIRHSIANEYQGLFAPKGVRPETLLRQVNTVSLPDSAIPPGFRG